MRFLEESFEKMQKIQILTILRVLYSKSGSTPLMCVHENAVQRYNSGPVCKNQHQSELLHLI